MANYQSRLACSLIGAQGYLATEISKPKVERLLGQGKESHGVKYAIILGEEIKINTRKSRSKRV